MRLKGSRSFVGPRHSSILPSRVEGGFWSIATVGDSASVDPSPPPSLWVRRLFVARRLDSHSAPHSIQLYSCCHAKYTFCYPSNTSVPTCQAVSRPRRPSRSCSLCNTSRSHGRMLYITSRTVGIASLLTAVSLPRSRFVHSTRPSAVLAQRSAINTGTRFCGFCRNMNQYTRLALRSRNILPHRSIGRPQGGSVN